MPGRRECKVVMKEQCKIFGDQHGGGRFELPPGSGHSTLKAGRMDGSKHRIKAVFLPYGTDNPYTANLSRSLSKMGVEVDRPQCNTFFLQAVMGRAKPDILHLHWLSVFFQTENTLKTLIKLLVFLCQTAIVRLGGVKIVWTAHNLQDHEQRHPVLDRVCRAAVMRLSNAILVHSQWAKDEMLGTFGLKRGDKIHLVPHSNYIDTYKNRISRATARKALGLDEAGFVFLFLGEIRPYKGVPELIDAFRRLNRGDCELVIAGMLLDESFERAVRVRIEGCVNIKFAPGFIPGEEIQVYMNACDVVVFPFRRIFTSGSVILAMSFGKACVAPRLACVGELLDERGAFMYDPQDDFGLLSALRQASERRSDIPGMGTHNRQLVEHLNWERQAGMTADVYRIALAGKAGMALA